MASAFDNCSTSYQDFITALFAARFLDSDERIKLVTLAPLMTEAERREVIESIRVETDILG